MSRAEGLELGHHAPPPIRRSLRPSNPIAILGTIMVGLTAMLLPEAVVITAIASGHAPSLDAIQRGDPSAFPLVTGYVLVRQGVFLLGALAVAALATGSSGRGEGRAELGFRGAPVLAVIAGACGIVGLGPTSDLLIRLLRAAAPGLDLGVLNQIDELATGRPFYVIWPLFALLPGLAEETYFRGLVQHLFGRGLLAILFSGVIFAVLHIDPIQAIGVLPVGLYLAWLADRTRSLWAPIAAHATNNTLAVLATRVVPETDTAGAGAAPPPVVIVGFLIWTAAFMYLVHRTMKRRELRD
jgi:membrane protease YdiL (CAAX protease family)